MLSAENDLTGEVAEMCPAHLELWVGATVVLDRCTTGVCESWTASDWCQRNVDVVVVVHYGRRRSSSRRLVVSCGSGRSARWSPALSDATRTTR